jgi:formylglycine-generating enzyme required for sulfatase activity
MQAPSGVVKVLDLGLARLSQSTVTRESETLSHQSAPTSLDESTLTRDGQAMGSPGFVSPEQVNDSGAVDQRADIFSLGATCCYLMTGAVPFPRPAMSRGLAAIGPAEVEICINALPPAVPLALRSLLRRMMSHDPTLRPSDMSDVALAFKEFTADPIFEFATRGSRQRLASAKYGSRDSRSRPGRRLLWGTAVILVTALTIIAFVNRQTITLIVEGKGELVVRGDLRDVSIHLRNQHGAEFRIDVNDDWPMRIAAGSYDIEIVGDSDKIRVNPSAIVVHRGQTAVVTLERFPPPRLPSPVEPRPIELPPIEAPPTIASRSPDLDSPARKVASPRSALAQSFTNSIGMRLNLIPAGTFLMGSPADEPKRENVEGPQHEVRIIKPFYLGVYEVTQADYRRVMGNNPSFYSRTGGGATWVRELDTDQLPVDSVAWQDAADFCRKLSALPPEQRAKRRYRLPTEAEWEYACRANTMTPFHFGSSLSSMQANFKGTIPYGGAPKGPFAGHPVPVGSYKPYLFGLYDIHGDVWEWCQDWYGPNYFAESPADDPRGPRSGSRHVMRGGGWGVSAMNCRSAHRNEKVPPIDYLYSSGFRAAAEIDAQAGK